MSAFNNNIKSETQLPKKQQFLQSNSDKKLEVICGDVTEDHQMKMPVSQLQEFCAKKSMPTPLYRLIKTEGQSHSPLFTIQVLINGLPICVGMASNKKLAKHNAAEKAIIQLKTDPELIAKLVKDDASNDFNKLKINDSDKCDSSVGTSGSNESQTTCDKMEINESKNNSRVNPVSNLQEICAKNGFSLPLYEILDQLGPPHDPIFWITCKILAHNEDICAKGSARTKQVAKRIAAQEVLNILYQKDFISVTKKNKPKSHLPFNSSNDSVNDSKELLEFLEALYNFHELENLFENIENNDYCLRLSVIAEKLGCVADYIKLTEEQSKTNKFKCLLQLKKDNNSISRRLPVFASWGNSPVSTEQAMQKAAQKAIIMIKVLKM